jgi:hypothetical protein
MLLNSRMTKEKGGKSLPRFAAQLRDTLPRPKTRPPQEQVNRKSYGRARPRETSSQVSGEPLLRLASPEAQRHALHTGARGSEKRKQIL